MLVCPACRQANPEGATVCEHCGSQLTASFALRGGRDASKRPMKAMKK